MLAAGAGLAGALAGLFLMRERLVQRPDFPAGEWAGPAGQGNFATVAAPRKIDRVILHTTETRAAAAERIFRTPRRGVSAHYLVTIEGAVRQLVREQDIAYHAGNWDYNLRSIGIELEGWADGRPEATDDAARFAWQIPAQREALARLVRWACERHGIPMDRAHILGHNQVPSPPEPGAAPDVRPWWGGKSQHHDPGANWDWPGFLRLLGSPVKLCPVEIVNAAELLTLPQPHAPKITRLEPGTQLEAHGEADGFLWVTYSGDSDAQPLKPAGRHHGDGWIDAAAVKDRLASREWPQ
jgi:N-acetyl-anhydromuramyl-L-alanine amidase AmpD